MPKPRSKKPSKRERDIKEGRLPFTAEEGAPPDGGGNAPPVIPLGEPGAYFPIGTEEVDKADEPGAFAPIGARAVLEEALPPSPPHRSHGGHTRVQLAWSPFNTAQEVLDALHRAREQNALSDDSSAGGPEYVSVHGVVHPNYLRRNR